MKAFIKSIQDLFQQPSLRFSLVSQTADSLNSDSSRNFKTSFQNFFVAKDFSQRASFFFRVDGSQEYENEILEPKVEKRVKKEKVVKVVVEKKSETQEINYSTGIKYAFKFLVFPLVFGWILIETMYEFIVDSEDEISTTIELPVSRENSYHP